MTDPPRHVKVTVYMPPGTQADLDVLRAERRREGITVDRGAVIRAAIAVAKAHPGAWHRAIEQERGET
jgi:hypothetical protein